MKDLIVQMVSGFRLGLYVLLFVIAAVTICYECQAFWPADMIPHGPNLPEIPINWDA